MRDTAGIGLAWPNPSTSKDFLLLIASQFPIPEFGRRPNRSAKESVLEIQINAERALL